MKITITLDVATIDGPRATGDAIVQALEEELEGAQFDAQNERSEAVSVIRLANVVCVRASRTAKFTTDLSAAEVRDSTAAERDAL